MSGTLLRRAITSAAVGVAASQSLSVLAIAGGASRFNGRQVVAWIPNPEAFKLLACSGALPGQGVNHSSEAHLLGSVETVHTFEVRLSGLSAEQLEMIHSGDSVLSATIESVVEGSKRPLFVWQIPLVFIRQ
jgi:hypothetical protein